MILALTAARGPDKSICPSEVARALRPDWQTLMTAVRQEAVRLAQTGQLEVLRKGERVEPSGVKGVIRLRQARHTLPHLPLPQPVSSDAA